tara:strand:- start:938 stop:3067 length:2130 start_codon:yes stop_codon:yes gene_type:complete
MALNDVLNRPLFRQQALKKGALKPIHAQTGIMVGPPVMGSTNPINPRTQVPALRPNIFRRAVGDIKAFAQRPGQFFTTRPNRFTPGVGTAGLIATGGLAPIVGMGRRKLGISDESAFAPLIDYGIGGLLSLNPFFRAAGMAAQVGRAGLGALDYVRNQPIGTTRQAIFPQDIGTPLGLFDPIDPSKPRGRGARKRIMEERKKLAEAAQGEGSEVALTGDVKPDALVAQGKQELGTGQNKTNVIDITKVASGDASAPAGTIGNLANLTQGPTPLKLGEIESKPDTPVVEKKTTAGKADVKLQQDTNALDDDFKKTIAKARLIKEELMQGQTSNAKLVFMANLAQGLLTGTTRKQGVGGALEVFGNAIGPATTNYATMKLKENELENNLMGDALELVSEENKSRNEASALPKIKQFGVIQVQDANNQARNIVGVQYENGTFGVATGQFDQFGREIFAPVPAGSVNKFIEHSKGQGERDKTIRDLSGKYKAYQIGLASINILKSDDVTGGPVGRINLVSKRLGDALNDFGIGFLGRDEGKKKIAELKDQYIQQYMEDNDVDEDVARKVFEDTFGKGDSYLKKTLKQLGAFKGTGADLEQLAINETILTYALANSLKSKDRLTQKDIQMAAKLVNVFPLLRGEKSVIEALEAVNNTLIKDIQAAEFDYINAFGGDNRTIDNYRKRYGIAITGQAPTIANPYADKSTKDLLKDY